MENAVEALKTAAAVLVFIIAITVSFSMFSKAKATADAVTKSQDEQEYLEAAELESKLYISSEAIEAGQSSITQDTEDKTATMTTSGDRIVQIDDVISTIYRYNLEKYGVTIIDNTNADVIARFDSNTENLIRQWTDITSDEQDAITAKIKGNISNKYVTNIKLNLQEIYSLEVDGNSNIKCGAPWYGNDSEIIKRINTDITGGEYKLNQQSYEGKNLREKLEDKEIIEVVNEIDNSKYLSDEGTSTSLLQQYELPTIEIIYIVK